MFFGRCHFQKNDAKFTKKREIHIFSTPFSHVFENGTGEKGLIFTVF